MNKQHNPTAELHHKYASTTPTFDSLYDVKEWI
jgi:hypothetical protein